VSAQDEEFANRSPPTLRRWDHDWMLWDDLRIVDRSPPTPCRWNRDWQLLPRH